MIRSSLELPHFVREALRTTVKIMRVPCLESAGNAGLIPSYSIYIIFYIIFILYTFYILYIVFQKRYYQSAFEGDGPSPAHENVRMGP